MFKGALERSMRQINNLDKPLETAAEKAFKKKRIKEMEKIRSERDRVFADDKIKLDRE